MEEDDKPFGCPHCEMRFVSEDRLSVHKERHNFSLNLNTSTPKISLCNPNDISDQTPTPTRFIKNCDEEGLFSDFPNPFDEQFRRASQSGNDALVINNTQPSESLNTPYIPIFTSEILSKQNQNNQRSKLITPQEDSDTNPFPIISLATAKLTPTVINAVATSVIATNSIPQKCITVLAPMKNENSAQTSVITSVGNKPKVLGKPTAVVVKPASNVATLKKIITKPAQIAPNVATVPVETGNNSTPSQGSVLQLILKLPDGQSMPFNIPVVPANTTAPNVVAVAAPSAGISTIAAPSQAKIKLKDTIEQQINLKSNPVMSQTFGGSIVKPKNVTSNFGYAAPIPPINIQNVATVVPTVRTINSNISLGAKRKNEEIEDEAEKRRKFLERNRAAATRCRKKRKREYEDMKGQVMELNKQKEQLQGMVSSLRKDVANLKKMLLAHKDCPVTQQQKSAGQMVDFFSFASLSTGMQMNHHQASSFNNETFQTTISGLTSNDGGGSLEVEIITGDNISQGSSSNMDSFMGPDTSNDDSQSAAATDFITSQQE